MIVADRLAEFVNALDCADGVSSGGNPRARKCFAIVIDGCILVKFGADNLSLIIPPALDAMVIDVTFTIDCLDHETCKKDSKIISIA